MFPTKLEIYGPNGKYTVITEDRIYSALGPYIFRCQDRIFPAWTGYFTGDPNGPFSDHSLF